MKDKPFPELKGWPVITKDNLVDLGGWDALKDARALVEADAVRELKWENAELSGRVGTGGKAKFPKLQLPSLRRAENQCSCRIGREGFMCHHAIALGLATQKAIAYQAELEREAEEAEAERLAAEARKDEKLVPKSLMLSEAKGKPLQLLYLLPPNIERAAPRDAIPTRVLALIDNQPTPLEKINRGHAYHLDDEAATSAWLIEDWCNGKLSSLIQLRRDQLHELIEINIDQPVFFWVNKPNTAIAWVDDALLGVSEHLQETPEEEPSKPVPKQEQAKPQAPPAKPKPKAKEAPLASGMEVDGSTKFLSITLPSRESVMYAEALELLKQNGFNLEPRNRKWWLRGQSKTLNFLSRHKSDLVERYGATFTSNYRKQTRHIKEADWDVKVTQTAGGFSLETRLNAGGADVSEIARNIASGRSFIERGEKIFLLSPEKLKRIEDAQRALAGNTSQHLAPSFSRKLKPAELRDVEAIMEESGIDFIPPEEWQRRSAALSNIGQLQPAPIEQALDDTLRSYQRIGVAWLWHLYQNDLGGILADEMGLGKTIQALAFISAVKPLDDEVRALVVCPAGLVENWYREAAKFTPYLRCYAHHGSDRIQSASELDNVDILITSYQTANRDYDLLKQQEFSVIIADEAQHIKNRRSQAAATLRALHGRGRFLLTGTPIENSLDDLRALFAFILPGYLAEVPSGKLDRDSREWYSQRHREQAGPYILRRSKQLVAPELPDKIEQVVYCRMPREQQRIYHEYQVKSEKELMTLEMNKASEARLRMAVFTQLLRMRQICVDPRLVDDKAKASASAKLAAFSEILEEAVDGGRRMLVFSQFTSALKLLEEYLKANDYKYLYLDGKTKNRASLAEQFNNDASVPVFLISLKAGGTGLNLTGADMVLHYDPWWNPAVEAQATDRAHRIGQTRQVDSIKLITTGTIEEKVLALQKDKAELLKDLLEASEAANAKIGLKEMMELLRD